MNATTESRAILSHLLRAVILAGIAFYIVHLNHAGALTLYIAPRMTIFVKLAALGLYAIASVLVYEALKRWNDRRPDQEACEHCAPASSPSLPRRIVVYALFIVPLSVFFLTPDTTIGSAMASQKGMNLSTPASLKAKSAAAYSDGEAQIPAASPASGIEETIPGNAGPSVSPTTGSGSDQTSATAPDAGGAGPNAVPSDPLDALFPADPINEMYARYAKKVYKQPLVTVSEKSYMEILTTLDLYSQAFSGHRIAISGFVYRDPAITNDDFVIGRFAMQCCAADALPYGVLVEAPNAKSYKDNAWLKITGKLSTTRHGDNDVLLLQAEQIEKIKPAKDPYVYGDLDFGS